MQRLAAENTRFVEARYALGPYASNARRFAEAQAHYLEAWRTIPRFSAAAVMAADLAITSEDYASALDLSDAVLTLVPDHWRATIDAYLRSRESLKGIVLVMDARHPLRDFDRMMLDFARATGRESLCLLTKADKLSRGEAARTLHAVRKELATLAPGASAQLFSSLAGSGVDEARGVLAEWLFGRD